LLLDEPTVGIDPVLRRVIWEQFRAIRQAGRTIVISTHVMDEVAECDTAALIYHGRLLHHDRVPALLAATASGRIEELFFKAAARTEGGAPCGT
jgi:ABC-2 type transport system ATP-binding protein